MHINQTRNTGFVYPWLLCIALVLAATMLGNGCKPGTTVDRKLVAAYTDVLVSRYSLGDSTHNGAVFDSVAQVHGYTADEMRAQLRALANDYNQMKAFYDSVTVRLDSMRNSATSSDIR